MPERLSLRDNVAEAVARVSCSFDAFLWACAIVAIWGLSGPHFGYSDTWQLVINTGTTIVTFLMAFLIAANQRAADKKRDAMMALLELHQEQALTAIAELHRLHLELRPKRDARGRFTRPEVWDGVSV